MRASVLHSIVCVVCAMAASGLPRAHASAPTGESSSPMVLFPMSSPGEELKRVGTQTTRLQVEDVTCAVCKDKIEASLWRLKGVSGITFKLKDRLAEVTYVSGKITPERLVKAIKKAGYAAQPLATY